MPTGYHGLFAPTPHFETTIPRVAVTRCVVRQPAPWMERPGDDTILELIREHGHLSPAAVVHYADGAISRSHAQSRCSELSRYGLLERVVPGLYRITEDGEAWLAGELDAAELNPE